MDTSRKSDAREHIFTIDAITPHLRQHIPVRVKKATIGLKGQLNGCSIYEK